MEQNHAQFIYVTSTGEVTQSDNKFFDIALGSSIYDFHPFFHQLDEYNKEKTNDTFSIDCININHLVCDIEIHIKPDNQLLIVLIDNTSYYNRLQRVAQKKNESLIYNEFLSLKNDVLKEQETFKNQFIGNFSHELRNPLTLICAFSSLLKKGDLNLEQSMMIDAIYEQSNKLKYMLDDIIDLSILNTGILELNTTTFTLESLWKPLRLNYKTLLAQDGIQFNIQIDPKLPQYITADKRRVEQIITNLLQHCIRYNKGNEIELHLKENQRRANKLSLRIEVVMNDGVIPEFNKISTEQAFNSFTDNNIANSFGLGMSITRELAQLMDGEIKLVNKDNITKQVANLKVSFPLHHTDHKEIKADKFDQYQFTDKVKTIIAEENEITQMTATKILVNSGNFDTQVFTDPRHLLEAIAQDEYDLILMSSSLNQVDAIELLHMIKEYSSAENKKTPVLAVTKKTSPEDLSAYKKAGFKAVVKKPYTDDELLQSIYDNIKLKKFL